MDLILWRHAQAFDLPPGMAAPVDEESDAQRVTLTFAQDLARVLTPKGERQAERMAQWLNQRLPESTRILVSPAQRTQQTASALGRTCVTVRALHPGASVADLLKAAKWPHAKDPVLIVGHQPTLGLLAAHLLAGQAVPWSVRKGAVWWLRSREREGGGQVTLHAVQSPDFL
jgi:phosphohistidine phosphatase